MRQLLALVVLLTTGAFASDEAPVTIHQDGPSARVLIGELSATDATARMRAGAGSVQR